MPTWAKVVLIVSAILAVMTLVGPFILEMFSKGEGKEVFLPYRDKW